MPFEIEGKRNDGEKLVSATASNSIRRYLAFRRSARMNRSGGKIQDPVSRAFKTAANNLRNQRGN